MPTFLELPTAVGLNDAGYIHGAVAADFGGVGGQLDGISDLYFGRPTASGSFYLKGSKHMPTNPDNHYVVVSLAGSSGMVNKSGIGATVEVQFGGESQLKQVDGGSMRGSQSSSDLVFGLGDESGAVTATITWPGGQVQSNVPLLVDDINVISNAAITVQNNSVIGTYNVKANGLVDWVFTWDTDGPSDRTVDAVIFAMGSIPVQCRPDYTVLNTAISGVTLTYTAKSGGGYTHVMTYADQDCVPKCTLPFQVESGIPGQVDISDSTTLLRVRVCAGF